MHEGAIYSQLINTMVFKSSPYFLAIRYTTYSLLEEINFINMQESELDLASLDT